MWSGHTMSLIATLVDSRLRLIDLASHDLVVTILYTCSLGSDSEGGASMQRLAPPPLRNILNALLFH